MDYKTDYHYMSGDLRIVEERSSDYPEFRTFSIYDQDIKLEGRRFNFISKDHHLNFTGQDEFYMVLDFMWQFFIDHLSSAALETWLKIRFEKVEFIKEEKERIPEVILPDIDVDIDIKEISKEKAIEYIEKKYRNIL